jgi:hypothetical protein
MTQRGRIFFVSEVVTFRSATANERASTAKAHRSRETLVGRESEFGQRPVPLGPSGLWLVGQVEAFDH